jgi:hypothetical protein
MGSTLKFHRENAVSSFGEDSSAVKFIDGKIERHGEDFSIPTDDNFFVPMLTLLDTAGKMGVNTDVSDVSDDMVLIKLLSRVPVRVLKEAFMLRLAYGEKLTVDSAFSNIENLKDFTECLSVLVGVYETKKEIKATIEVLNKLDALTDSFSKALTESMNTYKGPLPFERQGDA